MLISAMGYRGADHRAAALAALAALTVPCTIAGWAETLRLEKPPPLLHPEMAQHYRRQVGDLWVTVRPDRPAAG